MGGVRRNYLVFVYLLYVVMMSSREVVKKGEKLEKVSAMAEKVVVAVKASKEIPKTALVWALTHVVQPGDCITLLVVISSHSSGNNFFHFFHFLPFFNNGILNSCFQFIYELNNE